MRDEKQVSTWRILIRRAKPKCSLLALPFTLGLTILISLSPTSHHFLLSPELKCAIMKMKCSLNMRNRILDMEEKKVQ